MACPSANANAASADVCQMTAQEWCARLEEQERISFNEYRSRPSRLISDFNGELAIVFSARVAKQKQAELERLSKELA